MSNHTIDNGLDIAGLAREAAEDLSTHTKAIERGMALLDKAVPGWLDLLDVEHLDMSAGSYEGGPKVDSAGRIYRDCGCVLAQVDYHTWKDERSVMLVERLGLFFDALESLDLAYDNAVDHGFTLIHRPDGIYNTDRTTEWGELTVAWKEAIDRRMDTDEALV